MRQIFPLLACAVLAIQGGQVEARDLLVTVAKDEKLHVFDAAARSLLRSCDLGVDSNPGVLTMSPDQTTAYLLVNKWEDILGIDINTCERTFYAQGSEPGIRRKSIASLAVSADGSEIYTVRYPTALHSDHYEVLPAEFVVWDTQAGMEAIPKAVFEGPRRTTVMAAGQNGKVYAAGHDIFAIDPATGTREVAIANASWDRPTYSGPDVLAFWPIGTQNKEFMLLYSAAVFADETQEELADFVWGYSSVDLESGETEIKDFASFEVIMFSAVRNPKADNELFGVYTQLSKHDVDTGELIKRIDLDHTYYVINISSDGSEVYLGGTNDDIAVYDTQTLEKLGEMRIPSGADMSVATLQIAVQG